MIGGRRIGYGRSRGRYSPPLLSYDGPEFDLKPLAPLSEPLSIDAPDSPKLAPIRDGDNFASPSDQD